MYIHMRASGWAWMATPRPIGVPVLNRALVLGSRPPASLASEPASSAASAAPAAVASALVAFEAAASEAAAGVRRVGLSTQKGSGHRRVRSQAQVPQAHATVGPVIAPAVAAVLLLAPLHFAAQLAQLLPSGVAVWLALLVWLAQSAPAGAAAAMPVQVPRALQAAQQKACRHPWWRCRCQCKNRQRESRHRAGLLWRASAWHPPANPIVAVPERPASC